jgi:hypothetical protein
MALALPLRRGWPIIQTPSCEGKMVCPPRWPAACGALPRSNAVSIGRRCRAKYDQFPARRRCYTGDPSTNNELQVRAKPRQVESGVNLPYRMIFRYRLAEMKLVEQLTLVFLQKAHHGSTSSRFASTQRNHGCWPLKTTCPTKYAIRRHW